MEPTWTHASTVADLLRQIECRTGVSAKRDAVYNVLNNKRSRRLAGFEIERVPNEDRAGHTYRWRRDGEPLEPIAVGSRDAEQSVSSDEWPDFPEEPEGTGWIERDGYFFDATERKYIFSLPSHKKPFVRNANWVQTLWRVYTSGATVADVTRKFSISRKTFSELKVKLGLTKTRAPWTDEELSEAAENALVDDALRAKEERVLTRAEAKHWQGVKKDAEAFRNQRAWVHDIVQGLDLPAVAVPWLTVEGQETYPGAVVVHWTDVHVGKRTFGVDHTLAEQVAALHDLIDSIVSHCRSQPVPRHGFVVPIGSDLLHSDTWAQTTTSGTPQGPQSVGSTVAQARAAVSLTARLVGELATIAHVRCAWVPGNHDRLASCLIAECIEHRFRDSSRITVDLGESPRKYMRAGKATIVMAHGDQVKRVKDFAMLAAREHPGCDLGRTDVFTGHLHTNQLAVDEICGLRKWTSPAPATADDWHHGKGYVGNLQAVAVYRVHENHGCEGADYIRADVLRDHAMAA